MELTPEAVESFLTSIQLGKEGGFGTTFEGRIGSGFGIPEQLVAIKKSHPKDAPECAELELRAQFENELKLKSINHNNIVKLVGYAESDKHFYLVYERIQGCTLEHMIEGEISWKKVIRILAGIASAIKCIQEHPCGPWVHCDICPSNIIVKEGTDVFSYGVLGVHLLARDSRTYFVNKDGVEELVINFYLDQWRRTRSILSSGFKKPKEAIHISELIVRCLHKEKQPPIKDIHSFFNCRVALH